MNKIPDFIKTSAAFILSPIIFSASSWIFIKLQKLSDIFIGMGTPLHGNIILYTLTFISSGLFGVFCAKSFCDIFIGQYNKIVAGISLLFVAFTGITSITKLDDYKLKIILLLYVISITIYTYVLFFSNENRK